MKDDARDKPAPHSDDAAVEQTPAPKYRQSRRSSRRDRGVPRSRTIAAKRITREDLRIGALMYPPVDVDRPATRADCRTVERPCPFVACRHTLYLDVNPETGSIKLNFPDREPWQMPADQSCALDVAERGGITLEEVGVVTNLTRERVRQVEVHGLMHLRQNALDRGITGEDLPAFAHPPGTLAAAAPADAHDAAEAAPVAVIDELEVA